MIEKLQQIFNSTTRVVEIHIAIYRKLDRSKIFDAVKQEVCNILLKGFGCCCQECETGQWTSCWFWRDSGFVLQPEAFLLSCLIQQFDKLQKASWGRGPSRVLAHKVTMADNRDQKNLTSFWLRTDAAEAALSTVTLLQPSQEAAQARLGRFVVDVFAGNLLLSGEAVPGRADLHPPTFVGRAASVQGLAEHVAAG